MYSQIWAGADALAKRKLPTPPLSGLLAQVPLRLMEYSTGDNKSLSLHLEAFLGKTLALGRSHSSWFLLCADLPLLPAFPLLCLNWIPPYGIPSPPALRSANRPHFVYHATPRGLSLINLLRLRDSAGRAVLKLTGEEMKAKAILKVLLDDSAVVQCCAHCGRWESLAGERFRACGACHAQYYCSETCQAADESEGIHGEDCLLLQCGKELEVEHHRRRHNNAWNIENRENVQALSTGAYTQSILEGKNATLTPQRPLHIFCECGASTS